jgi:hypothetical protein
VLRTSSTGEEMTRTNDGWMEMKAKPKAKVYHRVCFHWPKVIGEVNWPSLG